MRQACLLLWHFARPWLRDWPLHCFAAFAVFHPAFCQFKLRNDAQWNFALRAAPPARHRCAAAIGRFGAARPCRGDAFVSPTQGPCFSRPRIQKQNDHPRTYVSDNRLAGDTTPPQVWFAYTPDRKGINPQTHLAKFEGVLQADAYASINALSEDGMIREAACRAHARRKFHDLHAVRAPPLTTDALRCIAELYLIEVDIRGKPLDERKQVRQARSRPLLDNLERWLRATLDTLSRKSDTAAAILYAIKLWPALLHYRDDGAVEIDNSAAERALRGMAIGRHHYYPQAAVQLCIVHMVRNSLNFVPWKAQKEVAADLKLIYSAATADKAELRLEEFEEKWDKQYKPASQSCHRNWTRVIPFFDYPPEIRKVIYTSNAIESINMRLQFLSDR